jgi:predicted TIM-barrel fold metal-dependent hydrolase
MMRVIALEEHMVTEDIAKAWLSVEPEWKEPANAYSAAQQHIQRALIHSGSERLAAMDAAGVDVQVLSITTPGVQSLLGENATALAREANDSVAEVVRRNPSRFQGFATLPTSEPQAAARELDRAVRDLGLHGAMIFGRTRDRNCDDPMFYPIYETASALKAPLYMHPQSPRQEVRDIYYSGFGERMDLAFSGWGIGWHYETGIQIVRLILAGVFDRFPDLRIITGHWGEVVLFYLDRLDMLNAATGMPKKISEYFKEHVYVTPSGIFSDRYLQWSKDVLGAEHILMSTDYPYLPTPPGAARDFLNKANLSDAEREQIGFRNWERLIGEIQR